MSTAISSGQPQSQGQGQAQIRIEDLSLSQLSSLREQFDTDITNLSQMYAQLRKAQATFNECNNCVNNIKTGTLRQVLVPLTNSLYIRGELSSSAQSQDSESVDANATTRSVIVDVGTGYYLEKSLPEAQKFYNSKIEYLQQNSDKLAKTIDEKQTNLQVLVDIMQRKAIAQQQEQANSQGEKK